jgi:hypothetical protein
MNSSTAARTVVFLVLLASTGCATLFAGGPDEIPVRTNPPGAYVYVDGRIVGRTPVLISLDRNHSIGDIRIYYPGFMPVQVLRSKSFNLWTLGNFFLAIIPVVVDLATGDYMAFDDDEIAIALQPGQGPPPYGVPPQMPPTYGAPPPYGAPPQEPQPPQPVQ